MTRSRMESFFGFPAPLPLRQLPTIRNVINCYYFYKRSLPGNIKQHSVASYVAADVKSAWDSATIPTVSQSSLTNKIQKYITKAQNIFKVKVENRNSESFFEDINNFDQLFDIATCKCYEFG